MTVFSDSRYLNIEEEVKKLLGQQGTFLSGSTISSTRAIGDAIQSIISAGFEQIVADYCTDFSSDFARRAMADLAFEDNGGNYYLIDINKKLKQKTWMLQLCDQLDQFYPREIAKIQERIDFFAQVREHWETWLD